MYAGDIVTRIALILQKMQEFLEAPGVEHGATFPQQIRLRWSFCADMARARPDMAACSTLT